MSDFFPPITEQDAPEAPEPVVVPDVPVEVPVSSPVAVAPPEPVAPTPVEPEPQAPVEPISPEGQVVITPQAEANNAAAKDPSTPSPFRPQPGICGHCGGDYVEEQGGVMQCHSCGKWSRSDGTPIDGNPHRMANLSETFPWANSL